MKHSHDGNDYLPRHSQTVDIYLFNAGTADQSTDELNPPPARGVSQFDLPGSKTRTVVRQRRKSRSVLFGGGGLRFADVQAGHFSAAVHRSEAFQSRTMERELLLLSLEALPPPQEMSGNLQSQNVFCHEENFREMCNSRHGGTSHVGDNDQ